MSQHKTPYQRIMQAADKGVGVRLSASEVALQEKFEAWMENPLDLKKNADGKYLDLETCAYWITWQEAFGAGRSSLEPENAALKKERDDWEDTAAKLNRRLDEKHELESENERLRELLKAALRFVPKLVSGFCGNVEGTPCNDYHPFRVCRGHKWIKEARGAIRGGTNVSVRETR